MTTATLLALLTFIPAESAAGEAEPTAKIPNAKATFMEVKKLLQASYVDPELSEDELWTAALRGMLDGLSTNTDKKKVNVLLDPRELKELELGVSGSVSGVGIVIQHIENLIIITEPVPGGPAEAAGIEPSDRILAIDGVSVREMSFQDAIHKIRGPSGTSVDLLIQRDAREWTVPVTRGPVKVETVLSDLKTLPGGVGYVRIGTFGKNTVEGVDRVIAQMRSKTPRGLVLDLRGSPGGLLDVSLQVADRFLDKGRTILTIRGRDGKDEARKATGKRTLPSMPIVVLIDRETASSAEIVAAALAGSADAVLVGESTFGKGTVESIQKLANGFAVKLSVGRFVGPDGKSWAGAGLQPHFPIPRPEGFKPGYTTRLKLDPDTDAQLKAALSILAFGGGR